MHSKLLGGVLLIIGTTLGAGMLALPIATSELGFWGSLIQLIACWMIMTLSAFIFLEVNLWLPPSSNLISMAGATLGKVGQSITWVLYLLLLYTIICAYISGGGDIVQFLLKSIGFSVPLYITAPIFTILFATVVYFGIRSVDYVNRGLMLGKMGAYLLLVFLILPFISVENLSSGQISHFASPTTLTVTAVAFTSVMIVPSLRTYFNDDIKTLRKAIFLGMLIPLLCYITWDMVIMGVIPLDGHLGLKQIKNSTTSNSDLVMSLSSHIQMNAATTIAKFFTAICMATSFLSVSLSLSDFLADGFKVPKKGFGNVIIFGATFLPPLLVVLSYPDAFFKCLRYAGLCIFVLMIFLPPLMAWQGRYISNLSAGVHTQVWGGKFLLSALVLCASFLIITGLMNVL